MTIRSESNPSFFSTKFLFHACGKRRYNWPLNCINWSTDVWETGLDPMGQCHVTRGHGQTERSQRWIVCMRDDTCSNSSSYHVLLRLDACRKSFLIISPPPPPSPSPPPPPHPHVRSTIILWVKKSFVALFLIAVLRLGQRVLNLKDLLQESQERDLRVNLQIEAMSAIAEESRNLAWIH